MTVRFANEPNYELVEEAVRKMAVAVARSERKQSQNGRFDDKTPIENENGPQNRI